MTPAHAQALEALRETRDALEELAYVDLVLGCPCKWCDARRALAHADYVLALQKVTACK